LGKLTDLIVGEQRALECRQIVQHLRVWIYGNLRMRLERREGLLLEGFDSGVQLIAAHLVWLAEPRILKVGPRDRRLIH
jgi:hypothetical protein